MGARSALSLKSVGDFVSKNWEKIPDIIATTNDIRDAIKGKKGTSYVQEFRDNVKNATENAKQATGDISNIKGIVIGVAVLIGIIVLFVVMRKGR